MFSCIASQHFFVSSIGEPQKSRGVGMTNQELVDGLLITNYLFFLICHLPELSFLKYKRGCFKKPLCFRYYLCVSLCYNSGYYTKLHEEDTKSHKVRFTIKYCKYELDETSSFDDKSTNFNSQLICYNKAYCQYSILQNKYLVRSYEYR